MIAWDFVGPDVEDEEMRELTRLKRQAITHCWKYVPSYITSLRHRKQNVSTDIEDEKHTDIAASLPPPSLPVDPIESLPTPRTYQETPFTSRPTTPTLTHAESTTQIAALPRSVKEVRFKDTAPPRPASVRPTFRRRCLRNARTFVAGLLSPASLSVLLAFPIALVTPLKGLLVALPDSPIPNAPDGEPPLAFVMDTAAFVGAASVPLGLICLGAALARLKIPRGAWRALPLGAIGALALAKIVVSPVLGVLICEGLTRAGVIDRADRVLRFVCMCAPSPLLPIYN